MKVIGRIGLALFLCVDAGDAAQRELAYDEALVRRALGQAAQELADVEARWREELAGRGGKDASWVELFGYDPPGLAVELAWLHAFLYERSGDEEDARAAAEHLARMARYRADAPPELVAGRAEYAAGLPAVPSFFQLADYAEAWERVRGAGSLAPELSAEISDALASSADFVLAFPEWGAHNRAMLRAVGLQRAARAMPRHPLAGRWWQLSEVLAADSIGRWEIEDAQLYHPIWLEALARFTGGATFETIPGRYYLRYFLELLSPRGTVPEFGDAWWESSGARYALCLAWGAAILRDPELQWGALRVLDSLPPLDAERPGLGRAKLMARLAECADPSLEPRAPLLRSGPVLDDVIGKKLVLRSGGFRDGLYLLLNYRDEGDWGSLQRDFLRQTLAVEEEKAHHGHSDEGSIALLMHGGSVLLHDAGYRERAPSGPHGAWRADLFHARVLLRPGAPEGDLREFLLDPGAYRPTRTELVDFAAFERLDRTDYARVRVRDERSGAIWERALLLAHERDLVVVVDSVEATRAGTLTAGPLWPVQELVARGPGYAVGRTRSIGDAALPDARDLLIVMPGSTAEPESFPLERQRQQEQVVHGLRTLELSAGERAHFVTVLRSLEPEANAARAAGHVRRHDFEPPGAGVALELLAEDGRDAITLALKTDAGLGLVPENVRPRYDSEAGRWRAGAISSDADLVVLRRGAGELRWGAANMSFVELDGRSAFAAADTQLFQVSGRSDRAGRVKWRRWEDALR